jgi:hypothetical protein
LRLLNGMRRRQLYYAVGAAVIAGGGSAAWRYFTRFPPDTTPEGCYLRIAYAIAKGRPVETFSYLEEDAQHAVWTIHIYARKAYEAIAGAYPEAERAKEIGRYEPLASAADGAELWARLAAARGFLGRLRRDLSGITALETNGERATIVTARGTRYSFRRRPNGIWGLTLFTAELVAEADRLARDTATIEQAAADYRRGN